MAKDRPSSDKKAHLNRFTNFLRYYTVHRWILHLCGGKGKVLDFGCGRGELVQYLKQKNWRVYGIDTTIKKSPIYNSAIYKNFLFDSIAAFRKDINIYFDAAILNFSLEHCEDPLSTLREINALLKPDGFVFIIVPNLSHILTNKSLSLFQLNIPSHQHSFTSQDLTRILKDSGFKDISIGTPFCITAMITPPCSIFPQLDPMEWLYITNMFLKIIKGGVLSILSLLFMPYILLKSLIGHGSIMRAAGKK